MSEGAQEQAAAQFYNLHLYVYGKLIQGHNPRGPIKLGADHRMTGRSAGLPQDLQAFCAPERFFRGWQGPGSVDARLHPGGCMVYRPVYRNRHHYGLFARIQGRSEAGENMPGRSYTHCAVVVVEDRWEPWLVPSVARLLFDEEGDGCLGLPNYEGQRDRLDLHIEPLSRAVVKEAAATASAHPLVSLSKTLALRLSEADLNLHGRWLPFALGVKAGAAPATGRFWACNSDRTGPADIEFEPPEFTDSRPPVLDAMSLVEGEIDASRMPKNGYNTKNRMPWTAANSWPDQQDVQSAIAIAQAESGRFARVHSSLQKADPLFDPKPQPAGGVPFRDLAGLLEEPDVEAPPRRKPQPARPSPTDLKAFLAALRFHNPEHAGFVATVDLEFIRDARDYLAGQLASLSRPHFGEYRFSEYDTQILKAADDLCELSLRVVQVGDFDEYARLLDADLLRMPAVNPMGIPERGFGSPFSTLAGWLALASIRDGRSQDGRLLSWMAANHDSLYDQLGFGAPLDLAEQASRKFARLVQLLLKEEALYSIHEGVWARMWNRWWATAGRYADASSSAGRHGAARR